jgi:hypothetical protein
MAAGRPTKYTDEVIEQIRQAVEVYTAMHDIPIVAEFAYMHKVPRQKLYEFAEKNEEFNDTIKELIDKKEAQLERLALEKVIDKTMAIFSLKQLGWKDRSEIDGNLTLGINILDDVKQCKKKLE